MEWNEIVDKTLRTVDLATNASMKNDSLKKKVGKKRAAQIEKGNNIVKNVITAKKTGTAVTAIAAGASAAGGVSVAATSGAGIASGLAAAGGIGGMAAAPAVIAAGPAAISTKVINETIFKDEKNISKKERKARSAARTATGVGAAVGVVGAGAATVAGGASGAAIMSTLAGVGSVVGGGAIAGTAVVAAAPAVAAVGIGYGIYKLFGGKKKKKK